VALSVCGRAYASGVSISLEELQLAARNHGLPLEALRYPVTPVGLHYLLIHFDVPAAPSDWRLEVGGRVRRPLSLALDELRTRPYVRMPVTLECAGNGRARIEPHVTGQPWLAEAVGTGEWGGTPLLGVLEEAEPLGDAVEVIFSGLDRGVDGGIEHAYERSLPVAEALSGEALLAYELNGESLPPQHGFPLRLVVPGWYGMASVKWLTRIELSPRPFEGYQQTHYRLRQNEDDEGVALDRIRPRALMVPPGIPEAVSRRRIVEAGVHVLEGRAWSGFAPVATVEVSADGGASWAPGELGPRAGRWAWVRWTAEWVAEPGEHELRCRARDEAGNEQPLEPEWNVAGYANNAVQRIPVTVR
jgi:DMSO/TMAO reductase YedYZ molybdopterin-dependent catalytic subunit